MPRVLPRPLRGRAWGRRVSISDGQLAGPVQHLAGEGQRKGEICGPSETELSAWICPVFSRDTSICCRHGGILCSERTARLETARKCKTLAEETANDSSLAEMCAVFLYHRLIWCSWFIFEIFWFEILIWNLYFQWSYMYMCVYMYSHISLPVNVRKQSPFYLIRLHFYCACSLRPHCASCKEMGGAREPAGIKIPYLGMF